ncbi:MAG: leader peptide processing enzyme [Sphaerochaetaceae bacterium]|nr:leader peptide processing enzyme [Spirochaetales bacterium]MDY5499813.1 leader peptide processing enzyme [Sphaerochaetaceae bacterium]
MDEKLQNQNQSGSKPTVLNTILFMIFGTLLNLVLMVALFIICFVLIARFVPADSPAAPIAALFGFIISIAGSFFLYSMIVKKVTAKFHLESKMAPLFKRRKR